jgi:CheY-like chemotaxis protein
VSESQGLVLVVDDDSDVRESLELLLARHGYSVVTAADGLEALDRLRALPRQPSLIMLGFDDAPHERDGASARATG